MISSTLLLDSSQTTADSANVSVGYNPSIELDPSKQYEIGLISATTWHAMVNVKMNINDDFTFLAGAWVSVKITQGVYNVIDLNKPMKELITNNRGTAANFELIPNYNTLRARITLKHSFLVDFTSATVSARFLQKQYGSVASQSIKQYGSVASQSISYDGEIPFKITPVNTM